MKKSEHINHDFSPHNMNWNARTVQVHVDIPQIPLIKSKNDEKLDKDFVKIKFSRDPISLKLGLYELKMVLFYNSQSEYFLLLTWDFNITL